MNFVIVYLLSQNEIIIFLIKKILVKTFLKYLNYANVFLFDFTIKLFKHNNINSHIIKLVKGKQLFYRPIDSLSLI